MGEAFPSDKSEGFHPKTPTPAKEAGMGHPTEVTQRTNGASMPTCKRRYAFLVHPGSAPLSWSLAKVQDSRKLDYPFDGCSTRKVLPPFDHTRSMTLSPLGMLPRAS